MGNIYKIGDIDNEKFYIVPKGLFTNPQYKGLSNTARMVYAILKDRMELSMKNGWHDDNGDVYLIYTQENLADYLGITPRAIKKIMSMLKETGLISTKRQGLGLPSKIYIHRLNAIPVYGEQKFTSIVNKNSLSMGNKVHTNDTDSNKTDSSKTMGTDEQTDELQPLIDFCQSNVEILTPFKLQMLEGYVTDYGIEWVQKGLEKLAGMDRTKQSMRYLGGVLKGWEKDGVPKPWEQKKKQEPAPCFESDFIIG